MLAQSDSHSDHHRSCDQHYKWTQTDKNNQAWCWTHAQRRMAHKCTIYISEVSKTMFQGEHRRPTFVQRFSPTMDWDHWRACPCLLIDLLLAVSIDAEVVGVRFAWLDHWRRATSLLESQDLTRVHRVFQSARMCTLRNRIHIVSTRYWSHLNIFWERSWSFQSYTLTGFLSSLTFRGSTQADGGRTELPAITNRLTLLASRFSSSQPISPFNHSTNTSHRASSRERSVPSISRPDTSATQPDSWPSGAWFGWGGAPA